MIIMWPKNTYSNLKRVREIFSIFIKYGFYNPLQQMGLLKYLKIHPLRRNISAGKEELNRGQRVRMALEELGPTFIKLGQLLSTRRDLLPKDIIEELEHLQDRVSPLSFEEVKNQLERELKGSIDKVFLDFSTEPLASASIAQVHRATLKSGQKVVVKIQRPDIEKDISADIGILEEIALFLDHRTKYGKLYNFTNLTKDFKRSLYKELDFRLEEKNIETFRENFKNNEYISFPFTYKAYTTKRVLTMELIGGDSLRELENIPDGRMDKKFIAKKLSLSILEQILKNGFFHGDPHPGNIKVLPNNHIVFLDMGIVGKLGDEKRVQFFKMLSGITLKNSKLIVQAINDIGYMGEIVDLKKLESEIDRLKDQYLEVPIEEIEVGEVLNEIFQLAFQYHITIPNEFAMIAKALIILEGLIGKLDPTLNMIEIAKPITQDLVFDIYSPKRIGKEIGENILDYGKLFMELPSSILNVLNRFNYNDVHLWLRFKNEEKMLKSFNKMTNQLSFSIALLALSIVIGAFVVGMSLQGKAFGAFGINFVSIGLIASVLMGLWLFISIIKSGRF